MSVSISHENPSLGLSLQFAPLSLTHTIWHILSVPPSSPAATATLLPYSDYILGTPLGTLHSESALSELVDEYLNRPLPLWVYNSEYDVVRKITIVPSREWGGEGALGCTLGFGALHRIPAPLSEPVAGPGETLFSGDQGYPDEKADLHFANVTAPPQQFHVPAMEGGRLGTPELLHAQPVGHAPVVRHAPRKREKVVRGKGLAIDDYFNEGEAKSRALDYGSGKSANTPPPPPPKAGGPPRAGGAGPPMGGPPRSGSQGPSPPKANSPSREMACSPELTPGSGVVTPSAQQAIPDDAPAPWDAVDDKGGDRPETGKSEKSVD